MQCCHFLIFLCSIGISSTNYIKLLFSHIVMLSGLDIVRRDWCQLAADAGKAVINIIMTDKSEDSRLAEIQEHLESLQKALNEGNVALKDLEITKQLTKDPSDYPDKKSLAHVQVIDLLFILHIQL